MSFIETFDVMHAVAGLLVGMLVGLTGVGGGALMTPILVLMFGVSPQTAVGTDLLFAASTKTAGSAIHGWRETVDWKIVRRLAAGSIPASLLTLAALSFLGKIGKSTEHMILLGLGVMLVITAMAVLYQRQLMAFAADRHPVKPGKELAPTVILGAVIGTAVSITSIGAGAIGVTALLMLYPALPVSRIVGTDIAHAVPLALVAGFGHWIIGDVNLLLLGSLLVGSIPGVIVGSLLSSRAPEAWIRPIMVAVLLISGGKLLW